jgi:hypothetical protein
LFLAGLIDWVNDELPTYSSIAGCRLLDHGQAHIKLIRECGGRILGCRALESDDIVVPLSVDESPDSLGCRLRRGFEIVAYASPEQRAHLPVFSTWGYRVIRLLAEGHFGTHP